MSPRRVQSMPAINLVSLSEEELDIIEINSGEAETSCRYINEKLVINKVHSIFKSPGTNSLPVTETSDETLKLCFLAILRITVFQFISYFRLQVKRYRSFK